MDRVEIVVTFIKDGKFTGHAARTIDCVDTMLSGLRKPHQFMKHLDEALERTGAEIITIPGTSMF